MAHQHFDDINLKLTRLREVRHSAFPLRSDGDAIQLLFSAQDAFHALVCARDDEGNTPRDRRSLQS